MFLKIKKIPRVNWSSDKPYNFKPKFSTFFFLCFGLMLFGLGEGLLIVSFTGASPWSVLAQGISLNVNLSIGTITFLISVAVLILWIPLGQKPGMGTMLNAIIIALMIDLCIKFVPTPSNYFYQLILAIISVITVGIGGLHLPIREIHDHAAEQLDHIKIIEVGEVPAGLSEEEVAGKNSNPGIEPAVDRVHPAPGGSLIHHIVVNERGRVDHFCDLGQAAMAGREISLL